MGILIGTLTRLFPEGGIEIEHGKFGVFKYMDVDDVPKVFEAIRAFYASENLPSLSHLFKGSQIGRIFRVIAFCDDKEVGVYTYREFLDNPHGYGEGDFYTDRYVVPEFRQTPMARIVTADLTYMLFVSGLMKRTYIYLKVKSGDDFYEKIDTTHHPCLNMRYAKDSLNRQKYFRNVKVLEDGYELRESNGEIFQQLDFHQYYSGEIIDGDVVKKDKPDFWTRNKGKYENATKKVKEKRNL